MQFHPLGPLDLGLRTAADAPPRALATGREAPPEPWALDGGEGKPCHWPLPTRNHTLPMLQPLKIHTLWLFNIAMGNGPFIVVYLFKLVIFHGYVK